MIDTDSNVGASLREIRKRLRFSMAQMARRLNVSKAAVGHWETGVRPVPDSILEAYKRVAEAEMMNRRSLVVGFAAVSAVVGMGGRPDPEMAEQALRYGLQLGNEGDLHHADQMYRLAELLGDWSGDATTAAYVRARSATRGVYEDWTRGQVTKKISEALDLSRDSGVVVEANAAMLQIHVLDGDYQSARDAADVMERASETDEDHRRTAVFTNYVECMLGVPTRAPKVYDRYRAGIEADRVGAHEAVVYQARAMLRAGDKDGVLVALDAVKSLGQDVRIVGIGVGHVLEKVTFDSPAVQELRTFARV